ncbi:hypothetical protein ACIP88_37425 [Streptomyces uncialis]|uniref:hypothetical protein n=1 Tax=Streptomyces uncialis TaxID=1048205 RepID=UPI00380E7348
MDISCQPAGGIEWGAVSTWVSAVVTTIALAITGLIVWRDRRKDQRADAHYVGVRGHDPDETEGDGQGVVVSNQADRTIFDVRAHFYADVEGDTQHWDHFMHHHIEPKTTSGEFFFDRSALGGGFPYGVSFSDTDGMLWLRLWRTQELVRLSPNFRPRPLQGVEDHFRRSERGSRFRLPGRW